MIDVVLYIRFVYSNCIKTCTQACIKAHIIEYSILLLCAGCYVVRYCRDNRANDNDTRKYTQEQGWYNGGHESYI
jgi:hypothetical protein